MSSIHYDSQPMKIGELAKQSGLTASRIRFYESSGLLCAATRQSNGYRDYPSDALLILQIITSAQKAGFSLDEVRTVIPANLSDWRYDELLKMLQYKVTEIEALEARLAESKSHLIALITDIQSPPEGIDCKDNTKRLLVRHAR